MPVEALFDPAAAQDAALRNLLQRRGYASLDAVRAEAQAEGQAEGELDGLRGAVLHVLDSRGLAIDEAVRAAVDTCADRALLALWLRRAAVCADTCSLLDPP